MASVAGYLPARARELNEIPAVAVQVLEDSDQSIGLLTRRPNEPDAALHHLVVVAPEVVGREEEEDAPAGLVSDERLLLRRRGSSEQQRRSGGAWRRDDHPTLVLRWLILVFDEQEVQLLREEGDRLVVVPHDESDVGDRLLHRGLRSSVAAPALRRPQRREHAAPGTADADGELRHG